MQKVQTHKLCKSAQHVKVWICTAAQPPHDVAKVHNRTNSRKCVRAKAHKTQKCPKCKHESFEKVHRAWKCEFAKSAQPKDAAKVHIQRKWRCAKERKSSQVQKRCKCKTTLIFQFSSALRVTKCNVHFFTLLKVYLHCTWNWKIKVVSHFSEKLKIALLKCNFVLAMHAYIYIHVRPTTSRFRCARHN